jgi:hypothetical protein
MESMFPTVAIVKQVQQDDDYNRLYTDADVTLSEDVNRAELQLKDVDSSVHGAPLMNAKSGMHTFHITGSGNSPFKVDDSIAVICFPKGEMP